VQEGKPLIRRPKHSGSLIIDHIWNRLHSNLTATFVGDRPDAFFDPVTFQSQRVTAKGYATVDVTASYRLLKDRYHLRELTAFGKILNLFDEKYEQIFGFSAPGITFLLGLKGSL
jgi:vitamin B12 transporter